jgi:hypothetical protein
VNPVLAGNVGSKADDAAAELIEEAPLLTGQGRRDVGGADECEAAADDVIEPAAAAVGRYPALWYQAPAGVAKVPSG